MNVLSIRPRFRITLREAAQRHGLTVQQLSQAVRRRQLRVLRAGHQVWVSEADLATYLEATKTERTAARGRWPFSLSA